MWVRTSQATTEEQTPESLDVSNDLGSITICLDDGTVFNRSTLPIGQGTNAVDGKGLDKKFNELAIKRNKVSHTAG